MKIAISGLSGCGNTTTSTVLSKKLGFPLVNFTFRNLAKEKGMSLEELSEKAKYNSDRDKELDTRQASMARENENAILASRLAIWMLPEADVKVYLEASEKTRAERIMKREGGSLEYQIETTRKRDEENYNRYLNIYGIDCGKYDFADLVIQTDDKTAEQVADIVLEYIDKIKKD